MKKRVVSTVLLLTTAVGGAGIVTVAGPAPEAAALTSCGKGYVTLLEVTAKTGVYKSRAGIGQASEVIKYKYSGEIVRGYVYDDYVIAEMARTAAWPYPYGFMSQSKLRFKGCEQR